MSDKQCDPAELEREEQEVLDALTDPADIETFRNLMENAHALGKSAVELVREDPAYTSCKAIRKLCLKNKCGLISALVRSVLSKCWGHQTHK